ncbi:endonuclease domain-containing protein [Novosphingopyxis sp.]|uniref:endonuclease domain-containing protein n=1 Tax=Novosphingopyxis sp. TaxID=2709690 RepID=UPI003B5CD097
MGQFQPRNTRRARELRNAATAAERELWKYLSRRQLGYKFSRQMPVGPYFADFLCRDTKLIIEIDGFSHDLTIAKDASRTAWLEREGYRVMRFTNEDVFSNVEGVVTFIRLFLERDQSHPRPLPQAGGEKEARLGPPPACGRG